jgi:hypothetical protein
LKPVGHAKNARYIGGYTGTPPFENFRTFNWIEKCSIPPLTLAAARERREASRKLLANGKDPSLERRLEKISRTAGDNSFREVAEEVLDRHRREERSEAMLKKNHWLLEPAYAAFGDRPVGDVTAPELRPRFADIRTAWL